MIKKWFSYAPIAPFLKSYNSKEEMEKDSDKFLTDIYLDGDSGWSEEVKFAFAGYGSIPKEVDYRDLHKYEKNLEKLKTHEVHEEILDKKENYPQDEEDSEPWPYNDDFDFVAMYFFKELTK